jgi:hypothetical protein
MVRSRHEREVEHSITISPWRLWIKLRKTRTDHTKLLHQVTRHSERRLDYPILDSRSQQHAHSELTHDTIYTNPPRA